MCVPCLLRWLCLPVYALWTVSEIVTFFSSTAAFHPAVLLIVPCSFTPTSSSNPRLLMTSLYSLKRAHSFHSTYSYRLQRPWGRSNESWAVLGWEAHRVGKTSNEDSVNNMLPLEWVLNQLPGVMLEGAVLLSRYPPRWAGGWWCGHMQSLECFVVIWPDWILCC